MRTKTFTFTKRVRKTETFPAIEINLTLQEAADLRAVLGSIANAHAACGGDEMFYDLFAALCDFADGTPARCTLGTKTIYLKPVKK